MGEAGGGMLLEGLRIAAIALTWVFAGLALVWALVALLNRLFPGSVESVASSSERTGALSAALPAEAVRAQALAVERAHVAAIIAAALQANALPNHAEAPVGPAFEHGRTAPNWVTGNRARALQAWQPPRRPGD
jgi:Na+-transporting methylmalonyl-CoA/oxaloacetate decarboxylase gamma subunit